MPETHVIGTEASPIVVIDDFAPSPSRLVDDAAMLSFQPMGVHYPGVRAAIPPRTAASLLAPLRPLIAQVFGFADVDVNEALYSLVTVARGELAPIQRIPHFDGVEPSRLALLLYLAPEAPGGTAFYRHRATGFESVTAARLPVYREALEGDLARNGLPAPDYIEGGTSEFEETARFDGHYNRAILYRGNMLHCAWLPAGTPFVADVGRGRFTANIFLEGR